MLSIEFHFVAWICFIIGIFCAGIWLGYRLAEGTPSASHNKQIVVELKSTLIMWENSGIISLNDVDDICDVFEERLNTLMPAGVPVSTHCRYM